jgi:hypothetical protein
VRICLTRKPGDDNEFVARDNEVDVFEIVGAGAPNFDLIHSPFPVDTRIAWFVEGQTAETANYDTI